MEVHERDVPLGVGVLLGFRPGREHLVNCQVNVVANAEPGQERVALEHHAALFARAAHGCPIERDAASVRREQPGTQRHKRGLARAREADNRNELTPMDFEIEVTQHFGALFAGAITLAHALEHDQRPGAHATLSLASMRLISRSRMKPTMPIVAMHRIRCS
jgi:hypothetical protein